MLRILMALATLAWLCSCVHQNQQERDPDIDAMADSAGISNGFGEQLKKSCPSLRYHYDSISQIHNYSDNWDLDNDGILDGLYFVGTGGAHLYYYLRVILSSDKRERNLTFIETDFPLLAATDTLNFDPASPGFAVAEAGKDAITEIFVRLDDQSFHANKDALGKFRIRTQNIVLSFKNGKTVFGSLE